MILLLLKTSQLAAWSGSLLFIDIKPLNGNRLSLGLWKTASIGCVSGRSCRWPDRSYLDLSDTVPIFTSATLKKDNIGFKMNFVLASYIVPDVVFALTVAES